MLPLPGPGELSTAIPGAELIRSSPSASSSSKKSKGAALVGVCHVAPLSTDLAKPMLSVFVPGNRCQATYTFVDPFPAKRGIEDCPSIAVAAAIFRFDH